ncbi:MAG: membrane dipeptidase [Oscillospiraceae bacterium]|nr:membrane dipeptidase [Oscillospiraceae bacterium]
MKLLDLHCDTLNKLLNLGISLDNSQTAVTLSGLRKFEKSVRCFAIWVSDDLSESRAKEKFDKLYEVFAAQLSLFGDDIINIADKQSFSAPRTGLMLTVENGAVLNGSLREIERIASLGVKMLTITWNGENSLGFGQLNNRPLKPFGKECIPMLEQNGITVDVSHLSDRGFDDVCAISKKPFVASHSNCRSICSHKRNLADEQICEIIKRKGLIGLNFYYGFLNDDASKASGNDILRHAEHILSLGGIDSLAIGTDFDGGQMVKGLENDTDLLNLENLFLQNGFSREITDKILFENAKNFFVTNF